MEIDGDVKGDRLEIGPPKRSLQRSGTLAMGARRERGMRMGYGWVMSERSALTMTATMDRHPTVGDGFLHLCEDEIGAFG